MKDEGIKTKISEFTSIIKNHDIICLQETKEAIKISDYRCFNSNRKSSRSGGVCICVRNNLSKGVIKLNTSSTPDIIAIKLKKSHFNMHHDLAIINVYDPPTNSSYKTKTQGETTTIEHITTIIENISKNTDIMLVGDFNARTGTLCDQVDQHFDPNNFNSQAYYSTELPTRSSKDDKTNVQGKQFIDMIKAYDLAILNGRTLGDFFGEYTCLKYNGASVVDYICTSTSLLHNINTFKVEHFSYLSDHRPISTSIKTSTRINLPAHSNSFRYTDTPNTFKWDHQGDSSTSFRKSQEHPDIVTKIDDLLNFNANSAEDTIHLNNEIINIFNSVASKSLSNKISRRTNKKKWFDWECRKTKRDLNKLSKKYDRNQNDETIRSKFYQAKKDYKRLIKAKRAMFLFDLNQQIENGKNLNWKTFKKLKEMRNEQVEFDAFDLENFYLFFKDLYQRKCTLTSHASSSSGDRPIDDPVIPTNDELEILNEPISKAEVDTAIHKLRSNKSVSFDLISNEMLKHTNGKLRLLVTKVLNDCLQNGIYPWNESLTTPLHKKGDKENPDNYRAITVGSCLGKLFSSLLLDRITRFRRLNCPDHANQLGFCKGSQTSDHILTRKTMIDKYVTKESRRLYTCFVDYRKAFDRVCREALMYKLGQIGIHGNFFRCIQHMYSRSTTRIKLIKKVSEAINVEMGTEQGHPMSPELFKIFIHDLSTELNRLTTTNAPSLGGLTVNHLLWANDLVLLALDATALQILLNILRSFVDIWELEINTDKTNIMVFNTSGKILKESKTFSIGNTTISSVKTYCYLGITFSLTGSFKVAMDILTSKARRALFSMKSTVDVQALSLKSLFTLFDALIKPIAGYACQVWLPDTHFAKELLKLVPSSTNNPTNCDLVQAASKDQLELLHLRFIKWCLGLHKKASNVCSYGDTGRFPLASSLITQSSKYFMRVSNISRDNPDSLVGRAFAEQRTNNLKWYSTWNVISKIITEESGSQVQTNLTSYDRIQHHFVDHWDMKLQSHSKLKFYASVKQSFGREPYLNILKFDSRRHIAKLRTSAHDLNLEKGRYVTKHMTPKIANKSCRYCCSPPSRDNFLEALEELPFHVIPILETEEHVITECPAYHHLRIALSDNLKCLILLKEYRAIMESHHAIEFGKYLSDCYAYRNPST